MTANKEHMAPYLGDEADDDLPDLSTAYWAAKITKAPVHRGRPKATGSGWQTRINDALRKAAGLS